MHCWESSPAPTLGQVFVASPCSTSTQVDDLGDSQATLVGDDDIEVNASLPLASHAVDGVDVVIAFNSNRSDEDGGGSEEGSQPRGPSRMNGSPGRGLSLPEPHPNTGV